MGKRLDPKSVIIGAVCTLGSLYLIKGEAGFLKVGSRGRSAERRFQKSAAIIANIADDMSNLEVDQVLNSRDERKLYALKSQTHVLRERLRGQESILENIAERIDSTINYIKIQQ